jgi:hypothetical protein
MNTLTMQQLKTKRTAKLGAVRLLVEGAPGEVGAPSDELCVSESTGAGGVRKRGSVGSSCCLWQDV